MYMYMYIYVYVYIHTYTHTCIHTCIHTYIHTAEVNKQLSRRKDDYFKIFGKREDALHRSR